MEGSKQQVLTSKYKFHFIFKLLLISTLISSCAVNSQNVANNGRVDAVGNLIKESNQNPPLSDGESNSPNISSNSNKIISQNGNIRTYVVDAEVLGKKLNVNHFDYPVIVNPSVEKWIVYFTGRGRRYFSKYLDRGKYFIPEIAKVLKQNNMPQDLVYLAMIESGFNNSARSQAKAVGPWQFIKGTGVRYGLTINYWLDERRETKKATMAAIQYLRELYQEFGSWELAASGYNAGEGKIRRAIRRYKNNNFWDIASRRFLKRETRDYVPKIMAAAIITKNPELFDFEDPFKKGNKKSLNPTTLMHLADGGEALLNDSGEELTPKELEAEIAKANEDDTSEDPSESKEDLTADSKSLAKDDTKDDEDLDTEDDHATFSESTGAVMTPALYMVANPNDKVVEYEIKGPSDLFLVAKAAGLPYSTIKMLNPELMRWVTPPSMKTYKVKLPLSIRDRFLTNYNDDQFDKKVVFQTYTFKRGDNFNTLAKRFSTDTSAIRELNSLPSGASAVALGKTILLPIPTGYKRVIAGMYDEKPSAEKKKRRTRRSRRRSAISRNTSSIRQPSAIRKSVGRIIPKHNRKHISQKNSG